MTDGHLLEDLFDDGPATDRPTHAVDFTVWAESRYRRLLHAAHLLTGDPHRAQDLVQIALAKTHLAWGRVHTSPDAYVRRVIVTAHADWWRSRPWRETPTAVLPERADRDDDTGTFDDRDALLAALSSLTTRQRSVLVLRYFEQLSEIETAQALGCSTGTVKSTASKALAKLRAHPSLTRDLEPRP